MQKQIFCLLSFILNFFNIRVKYASVHIKIKYKSVIFWLKKSQYYLKIDLLSEVWLSLLNTFEYEKHCTNTLNKHAPKKKKIIRENHKPH